jgi:hypothetical protein
LTTFGLKCSAASAMGWHAVAIAAAGVRASSAATSLTSDGASSGSSP